MYHQFWRVSTGVRNHEATEFTEKEKFRDAEIIAFYFIKLRALRASVVI
jgi:hypothetical protein